MQSKSPQIYKWHATALWELPRDFRTSAATSLMHRDLPRMHCGLMELHRAYHLRRPPRRSLLPHVDCLRKNRCESRIMSPAYLDTTLALPTCPAFFGIDGESMPYCACLWGELANELHEEARQEGHQICRLSSTVLVSQTVKHC